MNVRFDRPNDPMTERLIQVISVVDAVQCVDLPTHDQGGTLDVVITIKSKDTQLNNKGFDKGFHKGRVSFS